MCCQYAQPLPLLCSFDSYARNVVVAAAELPPAVRPHCDSLTCARPMVQGTKFAVSHHRFVE